MSRDMTQKQFEAALERRGFRKDYFGYYEVTSGTLVYAKNGGDSRREQLAYLIDQNRRLQGKVGNDQDGTPSVPEDETGDA